MEKQLDEIFSKRGMVPYEHQKRNILDYIEPVKPHVAAAATAAGKTFTTAAKFELYYKLGIIKQNEKVLILSADKTILRYNFVEQFDKFFKDVPASFSYRGVSNKMELQEAIEDGVQVIIALPQLINDNTRYFKKLKWLVVDEAHRWYFADTIKKIINNCKPKHQFLLTGSPFKFNLHKNNFIIDYTTVRELYEKGLVSDVNLQVLHTSLALTRLDWNSMTDNLRSDKRLSKDDLDKTLTEVIEQLIDKLKIPTSLKKHSTINNITNNALKVFGKLEKTIIFTHGVAEADVIGKYLEVCGVSNIVSHSEVENDDAEYQFNLFKEDDSIKVLVAVVRGREGFDFPNLYNIIDMTYSQNFEVVIQMVGRLLRLSDKKITKVFYKVAPKNTAGYFTDWMDCLIQLFDRWYSLFNGRNTLDINVPNALLNRPKSPKTPMFLHQGKKKIQIVSGTSLVKGTKVQMTDKNNKKVSVADGEYTIPQPPTQENPRPAPIKIKVKKGVIVETPVRRTRNNFRPKQLSTMGFDLSLSFMERNDWFKLNDPLSTVATTSLGKIMLKFGFRERVRKYDDKEIIEYIKSCSSHKELIEKNNLIYKHIITNKEKGKYELVVEHLGIENIPFKWLNEEHKLQVIKNAIKKCETSAQFNNEYRSYSTYLGKLYRPNKSEEGRKKYDEFFVNLIKSKLERSFEQIIELALTTKSFNEFMTNYPNEYSYCMNKLKKIIPLRIEMEKLIPGWDNGRKSPNLWYNTPQGERDITKKYKELHNHFSNTAKHFNISINVVRRIINSKK